MENCQSTMSNEKFCVNLIICKNTCIGIYLDLNEMK